MADSFMTDDHMTQYLAIAAQEKAKRQRQKLELAQRGSPEKSMANRAPGVMSPEQYAASPEGLRVMGGSTTPNPTGSDFAALSPPVQPQIPTQAAGNVEPTIGDLAQDPSLASVPIEDAAAAIVGTGLGALKAKGDQESPQELGLNLNPLENPQTQALVQSLPQAAPPAPAGNPSFGGQIGVPGADNQAPPANIYGLPSNDYAPHNVRGGRGDVPLVLPEVPPIYPAGKEGSGRTPGRGPTQEEIDGYYAEVARQSIRSGAEELPLPGAVTDPLGEPNVKPLVESLPLETPAEEVVEELGVERLERVLSIDNTPEQNMEHIKTEVERQAALEDPAVENSIWDQLMGNPGLMGMVSGMLLAAANGETLGDVLSYGAIGADAGYQDAIAQQARYTSDQADLDARDRADRELALKTRDTSTRERQQVTNSKRLLRDQGLKPTEISDSQTKALAQATKEVHDARGVEEATLGGNYDAEILKMANARLVAAGLPPIPTAEEAPVSEVVGNEDLRSSFIGASAEQQAQFLKDNPGMTKEDIAYLQGE